MSKEQIKHKIKSSFFSVKNKINNSPLYGRTLFFLLFLALIIKGFIIYFSYKNLNPWQNIASYLASDIILIFFVQLLIMVNFWFKKRYWRLVIDAIVLIILLLYVVDMFTIFIFHSRVPILDIFALGSNGSSGFNGIIRLWISIFIIVGIIVFLLLQTKTIKPKHTGKNMLVLFSVFSMIYVMFYGIIIFSNIKINYIDNIVSLNLQSIKDYEYQVDEISPTSETKTYSTELVGGEGKDLNIILVFAESVSAIDSANVGGNNNMPYFDKIQKEGITFTNFVTNGTTSDTAHISTLLGVVPLINMRLDNTPYSGYKLKIPALPEFLNTQGYNTTFISSASLNFLKQRNFLSMAGFHNIIGEEAFEGKKTYTFESAPDGDLYDRVLQEVKVQTGKYFIGLQTISFHKPYDTPYGKTESLALQYSDEELFRFYQGLQNLGFFDNGILVILGDHRKMNAVEEGERDIFGPNRYTKSVATVVGSGIQAGTINSNLVQHTDFFNSIKRLVGHGLVAVDSVYNDVFTQQVNRNRGITNSEYYENNRYTVSSNSGDIFLFRNLSNLPVDNPIYNYFSSYVSFEFGDEDDALETVDGIKFIGHRGAIEQSPENTLESFLAANELGADGIEFDVSYTKDYENVVVHGDLLYASNCRKQKIGNLTFDRIQKNCTIVNGEKYMKLKKMLELIDGLFDYYFLEIKVYDESLGVQQTLEAIQTVKELNMQDRVIFISYSDAAREVLNSDPDIIFGWDSFDVNDLDFIGENNSKYFLAPYDLLTPEITQKARDLGKEVVTYTVNDTESFQRVIDMGVNIIMSDKVDLLKKYNELKYYHKRTDFKLKKSLRN